MAWIANGVGILVVGSVAYWAESLATGALYEFAIEGNPVTVTGNQRRC